MPSFSNNYPIFLKQIQIYSWILGGSRSPSSMSIILIILLNWACVAAQDLMHFKFSKVAPKGTKKLWVNFKFKNYCYIQYISESHRYNEGRQTQKDTYHIIPFLWFLGTDPKSCGVKSQNNGYLWENIDKMAHKGTFWLEQSIRNSGYLYMG